MDELFTRNQLSKQYGIKPETVAKILHGVEPNGKVAKYPAYTINAFEESRKKYYLNAVDDLDQEPEAEAETAIGLDEETARAALRYKLAQAEKAELDNQERKHVLISRQLAESFVRFLVQSFASKLRDVTKDKGDEFYNDTVQELFKDVEAYVNEEGVGDIINHELVQEDFLKASEDGQEFSI